MKEKINQLSVAIFAKPGLWLVSLVVFLFGNGCLVSAQENLSFENGMVGWTKIGSPQNIMLDSGNAYKGNSCLRIGEGYGGIMQKKNVKPFALLYYNAYIKSGSEGAKGYSFVRFYDASGRLLLEYKSKPISSSSYEKSGNYTEAPPMVRYLTYGVEKDSSGKGFIYVDNFEVETDVGEPRIRHKAECNIDQYMRPLWATDTIFNETVLLYSKNGQPASGKLLFQPSKVLSVRSYDLKTTYKVKKDYLIKGKNIERTPGSAMPFRPDTSFNTRSDLAWFSIASQWVVVSYIHKDKWEGPVPENKGKALPETIRRLVGRSPLKVVAFGMSITRGMDCSGYDTVPPYMPPYVTLFAKRLGHIYHTKIEMFNEGLPGSTAEWGAQYAQYYVNPLKPDLIILDFGMNDFWSTDPAIFEEYILTMINKIRAKNSKAEFILLSNMQYDPDYILASDSNKKFYDGNMEGYARVLKKLEKKGIVNVDMRSISIFLYANKKAKDCLDNPLHPNDYMARWYAQALVHVVFPD